MESALSMGQLAQKSKYAFALIVLAKEYGQGEVLVSMVKAKYWFPM
jgi:hypothetical protein